ncbi:hypothetical protein P775_11700 [Puniceibacterium antarcticum]|uniref:HTH tetR-type domain-containing protein n=1 Tax=Puniceibacterium antarcticum TaxID=1206336 RepID=A0A2G8REV1_9RHOB|nr:TetR/AcrR family transcriptional regulator C-terminal domain-containing protein [Puniceibacterium antarcticum]PIL20013.1 hypothetical protein P775_11700 [Puniceibacterium antarcticum]
MVKRRNPPASDQVSHYRQIADLFLANGYAGVSVDAINRIVGGSKRDLYRLYGDKEAIFKSVVADLCSERISKLQATMQQQETIEESLALGGEALVRMLLEPRTLALHRLLVADGGRLPDVAREFMRAGPSSAYSAFAEILLFHASRGEIVMGDAEVTARLFLDSISGSLQLRGLISEEIAAHEIQALVAQAVQFFLRALGPPLRTER